MNITKAFVGLTAVAAAALTLAPTAGAQEAGALKSLSAACAGESVHMFAAAACPSPFLEKFEYAPGETIKIHLTRPDKCDTFDVTSAGFAGKASVTYKASGDGYVLNGTAKAGATPGGYDARFTCNDYGWSNHFTITAPVKAKPPVTKPKGAADTGGGGTA
jgi:hypothetical protein